MLRVCFVQTALSQRLSQMGVNVLFQKRQAQSSCALPTLRGKEELPKPSKIKVGIYAGDLSFPWWAHSDTYLGHTMDLNDCLQLLSRYVA